MFDGARRIFTLAAVSLAAAAAAFAPASDVNADPFHGGVTLTFAGTGAGDGEDVEVHLEDLPGRPDVPAYRFPDRPYKIFTNPAPPDFRRPMAPEPHPYTVEPGRLQIELEPLSFAYDRHSPERENVRVRAWEVPVTFKVGVLHDVDFQIGVQAFAWERVDDVAAGTTERDHGFGDITLRSKINLWGNDEDIHHAFSLMPFVTLPTARHDLGSRAVQGGVMFPFAIVPADGWELEWTPHAAAVRDGADRHYEAEWGSLFVVNRLLVEDLEAFVEFEAVGTSEDLAEWQGSINVGLTWEITPDTILEPGAGFGVTRAADDFTAFFAIVQRF